MSIVLQYLFLHLLCMTRAASRIWIHRLFFQYPIFGVRNNIWDQIFCVNKLPLQLESRVKHIEQGSSQAWIYISELIGRGGAHKHSYALKSLFIQNTSSITKFLPTSLTTCYEVKNQKYVSKLSELNFFPHKFLLPNVILNEGVNKLTRRKNFLRQKSLWTVWELSVCRKNVSITHRGSFVLLSFYGKSLVISAF